MWLRMNLMWRMSARMRWTIRLRMRTRMWMEIKTRTEDAVWRLPLLGQAA